MGPSRSIAVGDRLRTEASGVDCVVESFVGAGGQGAVYLVAVGELKLALKWYFPQWLAVDVGLRRRLRAMIDAGTPSDRYLWPIDIIYVDDKRYGYVMARRPGSYQDLVALAAGRINPSFYAIATAGFELANSFHELHARGLCYQDVSASNVFIDEASGTIRICDCDNVSVNNVPSAIGGTPGYIAPEIGLGVATPNTDTDRFSLAVLLFEMLVMHHPLLGARELLYHCLDNAAKTELFYQHPLFIFDPLDDSNRPQGGYHDRALAYWQLYPQYMKDLFVRAFTQGLRDPSARVLESTWRKTMIRLRDSIVYCPSCNAETFYDDSLPGGPVCWNCKTTLERPLELVFADKRIVLNTTTKLYEHHLDPSQAFSFRTVLASVRQHPQLPGVFGLRNESAVTWTVTTAGGRQERIGPGQVVPLASGTTIDFATSSGTICQ